MEITPRFNIVARLEPETTQGNHMDLPETDMAAAERSNCSVALAACGWGDRELAREIALLEAHLSEEKIHRTIHIIKSNNCTLTADIEEELRQSYLDYAMSVIVSGALDCVRATKKLRYFSQRAMAYLPSLRHRLTSGLAIQQIVIAQKACAAQLLKLHKSAESAFYNSPLFAYGPELSEFRHRHR